MITGGLKMKKISVFLSLLLVIVLVLGACGGDDKKDESKDLKKEENQTENQEKESSSGSVDTNVAPTIENSIIYELDGAKLLAEEMTYVDSVNAFALKLKLENNSDKAIDIIVKEGIVDNVLLGISGIFGSIKAKSGESVNDFIFIDVPSLKKAGLKNLGEIQFRLHVEAEGKETISTEPIKIKTSEYGVSEKNFNEEGIVLFDKDGVKVVGKKLLKGDLGDEYQIFIKNDTDEYMSVRSVDGKIVLNGKDIEYNFEEELPPHTVSYPSFYFMGTDLEDLISNGIKSLKIAVQVERGMFSGDILGVGDEVELIK